MPKLSKSQLEARRTEILRAALRCFSRRGFDATAMTDVAAEAEVAVGTLYSYFNNKQDLMRSLARYNRGRTEAFIGQFRSMQDPLQAIERLVESAVRIMANAEAEASLRIELQLWASALSDKQLRRWIRNLIQLWEDAIGELIQRGQAARVIDKSLDPAATARAVFALVNGLSVLNVMGAKTKRRQTTYDERVTEVVRAFLNGLS